jgi:hypothetical protein
MLRQTLCDRFSRDPPSIKLWFGLHSRVLLCSSVRSPFLRLSLRAWLAGSLARAASDCSIWVTLAHRGQNSTGYIDLKSGASCLFPIRKPSVIGSDISQEPEHGKLKKLNIATCATCEYGGRTGAARRLRRGNRFRDLATSSQIASPRSERSGRRSGNRIGSKPSRLLTAAIGPADQLSSLYLRMIVGVSSLVPSGAGTAANLNDRGGKA